MNSLLGVYSQGLTVPHDLHVDFSFLHNPDRSPDPGPGTGRQRDETIIPDFSRSPQKGHPAKLNSISIGFSSSARGWHRSEPFIVLVMLCPPEGPFISPSTTGAWFLPNL